jgi:hypothetical protein
MEQVPGVANVAVDPDTVQTLPVDEVKVTAKPELAVALKVKAVPTVCAATVPNAIV